MDKPPYTFDIYRILLDGQPLVYLGEVILRTAIMFALTLVLLRWMGKRGMGQLTPFEFAIIVALGSSVGDPMFYADVPVLPALVTVLMVVVMQRLLARATEHNETIESFVESQARLLVESGRIQIANLHKELLSHDELFEFLRQDGIYHLGQVALAYLEPSGKLSIIRQPTPTPGLSTLPNPQPQWATTLADPNTHCCTRCGQLSESSNTPCPTCEHNEWAKALCSAEEKGNLNGK